MESDDLGICGVVLGLMEDGCGRARGEVFSATRIILRLFDFWQPWFAANWVVCAWLVQWGPPMQFLPFAFTGFFTSRLLH